MFEDFHTSRFAWFAMAWMMVRQWGQAMSMAFGLQSSCEVEIFGMFVPAFVHLVFLLWARPFADEVTGLFETMTTIAETALLVVLALEFLNGIDVPVAVGHN